MTSFYHSPVGWLKLTSEEGQISSIVYMEEEGKATPTDEALDQYRTELDEYFSGNRTVFNFPMKQIGTSFQEKVWKELLTIPFGKTMSYKELSIRVGDVKAIRAVGTANGRNSLSIVVPCYRVIGSDASLTGYAGGLWRKQWLLEHERKYTSGVNQGQLFEL